MPPTVNFGHFNSFSLHLCGFLLGSPGVLFHKRWWETGSCWSLWQSVLIYHLNPCLESKQSYESPLGSLHTSNLVTSSALEICCLVSQTYKTSISTSLVKLINPNMNTLWKFLLRSFRKKEKKKWGISSTRIVWQLKFAWFASRLINIWRKDDCLQVLWWHSLHSCSGRLGSSLVVALMSHDSFRIRCYL